MTEARSKKDINYRPSWCRTFLRASSSEIKSEFMPEPTSEKLLDDYKEQLEDPYAWVYNVDGTDDLVYSFDKCRSKVVSFGSGMDPKCPCDVVIEKNVNLVCESRLAFRMECCKNKEGITMFAMDFLPNCTDAMDF